MQAWRAFWIGPQARLQFDAALAHWRAQKPRPGMLHGVCVTPSASALAHRRTSFESGSALLTECSGPAGPVLSEIGGRADAIMLDAQCLREPSAAWDSYSFKALARCCQHGTQLRIAGGTLGVPVHCKASLQSNGFVLQAESDQVSDYLFAPHWQAGGARAAAPGQCIIIGAGLAGAAVAASLARRGWQITVLEAGSPASGASGVPVGLLAPHISKDDAVLSRISRIGAAATWAQVEALLLPGRDWQRRGSLQRNLAEGNDVWHESGGWIKPSRLVRAWLAQPGITLRSGCKVQRLLPPGMANGQTGSAQWQAVDDSGECLASGSLVVLAGGFASAELLHNIRMPQLQAIRGQVLIGHYAAGDPLAALLPGLPVHGHGSLIPAVPDGAGLQWVCGATYQRDETDLAVRQSDHESNLRRLPSLLPETGAALARQLLQSSPQSFLKGWVGVRCASVDRLPLVGPLCSAAGPNPGAQVPGLWLCTALGSRGLTYAALCAELLAAKLHGEPLPLPVSLANCLATER
jgi:tRNA 5-methylaminomethyl-2-thiouridine biosynthesis bifunctional protein